MNDRWNLYSHPNLKCNSYIRSIAKGGVGRFESLIPLKKVSDSNCQTLFRQETEQTKNSVLLPYLVGTFPNPFLSALAELKKIFHAAFVMDNCFQHPQPLYPYWATLNLSGIYRYFLRKFSDKMHFIFPSVEEFRARILHTINKTESSSFPLKNIFPNSFLWIAGW